MVPAKVRSVAGKLALLGATLIVCFILAEVGLRLLVQYEIESGPEEIAALFRVLDAETGHYGLEPGAQVLGYEVNSLGYRGGPVDAAKPPGALRVITLGDSIVFGLGVRPEDGTLRARLEARLREVTPGRDVQVINAGVPGYNSSQELAQLREMIPTLALDVVVLGICLNDSDPIEVESGPQPLRTSPSLSESEGSGLRGLLDRSYFLVMLERLVIGLHPRLQNWAANQRIHDQAWHDMRRSIVAMAELSESHGIIFVPVVFPYELQMGVDPGVAAPQRDLERYLQSRGVRLLDLHPVYQAGAGELLFVDEVHPTRAGHDLAARSIVERLAADGWPPSH